MDGEFLEISLNGGFRLAQLERLIVAMEPLSTLSTPAKLRLDLGGLTFVSPAALTTLSAILVHRRSRGLLAPGSVYNRPRSWLVERYLARMNFHKLFARDEVAEDFVRRQADSFCPCHPLVTEDDKHEIADSLTDTACRALALGPKARAAVWLAIGEMAQNVLDHAASDVGGFAVAQNGRKRQEFEFAITDAGVGVRASLARNAKYAALSDDLAAIEKALEPGVTSSPGSNSGGGLSLLREAVRDNGGTFLVRSGTAAVESGHIERSEDGLTCLHGTAVGIRIRRDRPFRLAHGSVPLSARELKRSSTG